MTILKLNLETQLVRKVRQSNAKAFKSLFEYYYPRVVSYFYTRISDQETSEDLAQQVFINLWNSREKLDESKKFSSYIFTIAKNTVIDFYRKRNDVYTELNDSSFDISIEDTSDKVSDQIMELLNHISEIHKVTFLLHRLDGFSYKDLSECFGISVKAVEKRISTTLKFLRDHLK